MTKTVLLFAGLFALCCAGQARAETTSAATPQQNRMKVCSEQYHQKKIAKSEHQKFMSKCLSGEEYAPAAAAATPQQNRMKECSEQYHQKNIAKSEHKKFMSDCLKAQPAN